MPSRRRIARRQLAEHIAIAERLRVDPSTLLEYARDNVARWASSIVSVSLPAWLTEWQQILAGPLDALLDTLTADTEKAAQLRRTSPFVGVLTLQERLAILRGVEPRLARILESFDAAARETGHIPEIRVK